MKKFVFVLLVIIACISLVGCRGDKSEIIERRSLDDKVIYLTFDDGPSAVTEDVLNTLKRYSVKATFFVIGENVKRNPKLFCRITEEGHTVGVHSNTHNYDTIYSSTNALKNDINDCLAAIKAGNCSCEPKVYRFPGGSFNLRNELIPVPEELGLTYVDWNASNCDAEISDPTEEDLYLSAVNTSAGKTKVVMLMHDSSTKIKTALALPMIIEHFIDEGYAFKAM